MIIDNNCDSIVGTMTTSVLNPGYSQRQPALRCCDTRPPGLVRHRVPLIFSANQLFGTFTPSSLRTVSKSRERGLGLAAHQHVHPFQIVGQAHQTPFPDHRHQAPQRELPKAQRFLDDANDRFHRGFAQAVDDLADVGLEFVGHLDDGAGILGRGLRLLGKALLPTLVVAVPAGGDVRINAPRFQFFNRPYRSLFAPV